MLRHDQTKTREMENVNSHPNHPRNARQEKLQARPLAKYSTVKRATRLVSNPKKKVLEAWLLKLGMVSRTVTAADKHINVVINTEECVRDISSRRGTRSYYHEW
jgi:hypothetical protein